MIAHYNKVFLKELATVPSKVRAKIEKIVFEDIKGLSQPHDIPSLKKLSGFSNFYRIRVGDYRLGVKILGEDIFFERVLHRKEIYKRFP